MIRLGLLFTGTAASHIAIVSVLSTSVILIRSSTASTINFSSSGNKVATVVSSNTGAVITAADPLARMIWNGDCAAAISIVETVAFPCGHDITFLVHGTPGIQYNDGNSWISAEISVTTPARDLVGYCACVPGTTSAGFVLYATPVVCPPGCLTCTPDGLNCTACLQRSYRVAVPDASNQCPCLPSFYMDPATNLCVACPPSLYCKTCVYDVGTSAPKCASCYCNQHRVFTASTKTCDCDATHHQDGSNAYCAKNP